MIADRLSALFAVCASGVTTKVKELLVLEPDAVRIHSAQGDTLLTLASYNGRTETCAALMEAGASLALRETCSPKRTPILAATFNQHVETVDYFLKHWANVTDINAVDEDNMSALMHAAKNGYTQLAEILLKAGADTELRDKSNYNAYLWAKHNKHTHIAKMIENEEGRRQNKLFTVDQEKDIQSGIRKPVHVQARPLVLRQPEKK